MSGKVALLQLIATVGGSAVSATSRGCYIKRGISAWVFREAGEGILLVCRWGMTVGGRWAARGEVYSAHLPSYSTVLTK